MHSAVLRFDNAAVFTPVRSVISSVRQRAELFIGMLIGVQLVINYMD